MIVLTQCAAIPSHGFRAQATKYYVLMDPFTHISILSLLFAQMNCTFYVTIHLFFSLKISFILYSLVDYGDGDFNKFLITSQTMSGLVNQNPKKNSAGITFLRKLLHLLNCQGKFYFFIRVLIF